MTEGTGNVQQDAPADHPVGHGHHRVEPGPVAADVAGRSAPEHLPAHEHVGEGVDMGGPQPVHVEGQVVAGRLVARDPVGVAGVARRQHVVLDRVRVLGQGLGGQVVGQADRLAGPHQCCGRGPSRVGQVVQRAALVPVAPPVPVLEGLEHLRRALRWSGPRTNLPWAQHVSRRGGVLSSPRSPCPPDCRRTGRRTGRCAGPRRSSSRARSAAARPMNTMQISWR